MLATLAIVMRVSSVKLQLQSRTSAVRTSQVGPKRHPSLADSRTGTRVFVRRAATTSAVVERTAEALVSKHIDLGMRSFLIELLYYVCVL